jgi:hypothetical protein
MIMASTNPMILKSFLLFFIIIAFAFLYRAEIYGHDKKALHAEMVSTSDLNNKNSSLSPSDYIRLAAASPKFDTSKKVRSYHPSAALKYQLPELENAADKGDPYAACILSRALLLCKNNGSGSRLARFSSEYLASLSEKGVDSLSSVIASLESASSAICKDIGQYDFEEIDGRIYQSAAAGDVSAMLMFAMQSYNQSGLQQSVTRDQFNSKRHSEHAERMMSHAADTGDPDALNAIFFSYSVGLIHTPYNTIALRPDPVKAIAAFRALMKVDAYFLKSRYTAYFFSEAEKSIESTLSTLNDADKTRIAEMEDAYIRAYRAKRRARSIDEDILNELPQEACADSENQGTYNPLLNSKAEPGRRTN